MWMSVCRKCYRTNFIFMNWRLFVITFLYFLTHKNEMLFVFSRLLRLNPRNDFILELNARKGRKQVFFYIFLFPPSAKFLKFRFNLLKQILYITCELMLDMSWNAKSGLSIWFHLFGSLDQAGLRPGRRNCLQARRSSASRLSGLSRR